MAVGALGAIPDTTLVAMIEAGGDHECPEPVGGPIRQGHADDYRAAADFIDREAFDIVRLQHEFGISGGEAGALVVDMIAKLDAPLVTTLHRALNRPGAAQRRIMNAIIAESARMVVMAGKACDMLIEIHGADPGKIDIIAHGIPDVPLASMSPGSSARAVP